MHNKQAQTRNLVLGEITAIRRGFVGVLRRCEAEWVRVNHDNSKRGKFDAENKSHHFVQLELKSKLHGMHKSD